MEHTTTIVYSSPVPIFILIMLFIVLGVLISAIVMIIWKITWDNNYWIAPALVMASIINILFYYSLTPYVDDEEIAKTAVTITQQTGKAPDIESLTTALENARNGSTQPFLAKDKTGKPTSGTITIEHPIKHKGQETTMTYEIPE